MPYSLILDVVVTGLLLVLIPYVIRLNKRLSLLRRDKAQLEKLAVTFSESTRRADESLGNLRSSAEAMQRKLDSAQALHDDLAFLLERGEKTADRLEDLVRRGREQGAGPSPATVAAARKVPVPAEPGPKTTSESAPTKSSGTRKTTEQAGETDMPRSEAERELLRAIRSAN